MPQCKLQLDTHYNAIKNFLENIDEPIDKVPVKYSTQEIM